MYKRCSVLLGWGGTEPIWTTTGLHTVSTGQLCITWYYRTLDISNNEVFNYVVYLHSEVTLEQGHI